MAKKKRREVVEEEVEEAVDDSLPPPPKAKSDVYTGLLLISLIGLIAGAVFLFMDYSQYKGKPPQPPSLSSPAAPSGGAPK